MLSKVVRAGVVAGGTAAVLLVSSPVAWADGWFGDVDCSQSPVSGCDLVVGGSGGNSGGSTPSGSGGGGAGGPLAGCELKPSWIAAHMEHEGQLGTWFWAYCPATASRFPVFLPEGDTALPLPVLSPEDVARVARARLQLPAPLLAVNPAGDQLVRLPTWLWLESWAPVSATASITGVSVTATAQPVSVVWSMGDGSTVACAGPGTAYNHGGDPRAASPDCGHVYARSSARQPDLAYAVTATVRWSVTWSGAGASGTFDDLTTSGSRQVRVAESPALNKVSG